MADFRRDHRDGHFVMSTARHDDVCVTFARLDELEMHRLHRREILFEDFLERTPTLHEISTQPTNEADVRIRIHEHFDVTQIADSPIRQHGSSR